jgi:hypothetical protein
MAAHFERMSAMADTEPEIEADRQADFAYHQRTYRAFVRGVVIVTAHAAVVLLVLAYIFADSMG